MADPIRVKLNQLYPVAYLESSGGTIVTSGGQSRLDGAFAMVVASIKSDPVTFNATTTLAIVTSDAAAWSLQSLAKTTFGFSTPIVLSDGTGPWLRATRCWLIQPPRPAAMAVLSLDDVRASLISGSADPGASFIVFPTQNGEQAGGLTAVYHPENPSYAGFFVLPIDGGHAVHLGTPLQSFAIDHAVATDILVNTDSSILFPLSSQRGSSTAILLDSSSATRGALARAALSSNLMMATSPQDPQWSRLRLPATRIEVSGGWLRVTQFRDSEVWLGEAADPHQAFDATNSLFTPTNRLSYQLQLTLANPQARVLYSDSTIQQVASVGGPGRFYGLRVTGLGSRTGVRPPLDATQLAFELSTAANRQFHIKVGFSSGSLLVPKRDPQNDSSRSMEIPVSNQLGLRVSTVGTPSATSMQLDTETSKFAVLNPTLLSAPGGMTAKSPDVQDSGYSRWGLISNQQRVTFSITNGTMSPDLGDKWLNQFHTSDPSIKYGLIEHPGTALMIDGVSLPSVRKRAHIASTAKTEITTKTPGGKETVAYSAFIAVLSWAAAKCIKQGTVNCLDEKQFQIAFPNLDDTTFAKFVKQNGLQDLQVVYFTTDPDASKQIQAFVDGNMAILAGPKPEKFIWAFAAGLAVLLFDQKDANGPYCDGIARGRRTGAHSCIGFDFSTTQTLNPTDLGVADFTQLANQSPALWPGVSERGAELDWTRAARFGEEYFFMICRFSCRLLRSLEQTLSSYKI